MVLSWFGSGTKPVSVTDLIARKKYDKALALLREQFKQGSRDPRLRLQMADVLVLAGQGKQAVPILVGLADEYASEGFAAKAIALFKKIEKIEPGRKDVESKLATLIHQEPSTVPLRSRAASPETEIGLSFEPVTAASPAEAPAAVDGPPPGTAAALPEPPAAAPGPEAMSAEPEPEDDEEELVLSEDVFRDQLLDVIQDALVKPAPAGATAGLEDLVDEEPPAPARSPLFSDFSEAELIAVMQGLRLLSYGPGDIIITEGEPGDSLFVLTTGTVKAWIRNPSGQHVQVREMEEGSFFGEISILTGKPRTATVTAAASCELLVLDRPTLDDITARHPRVMQVLEEFHRQRSGSATEASIRSGAASPPQR